VPHLGGSAKKGGTEVSENERGNEKGGAKGRGRQQVPQEFPQKFGRERKIE